MLLPVLEYGDLLFSACSAENKRRLQVLQNRALRYALSNSKDEFMSTDELHKRANLLKLNHRREEHSLNFMFDLSLNPNLTKAAKAGVKTRSHAKRLLKVKRPKTEKFKKSLAYKGATMWNNLPVSFHNLATKDLFKQHIKTKVATKAAKQTTLTVP